VADVTSLSLSLVCWSFSTVAVSSAVRLSRRLASTPWISAFARSRMNGRAAAPPAPGGRGEERAQVLAGDPADACAAALEVAQLAVDQAAARPSVSYRSAVRAVAVDMSVTRPATDSSASIFSLRICGVNGLTM
jgi:hypothetical protein